MNTPKDRFIEAAARSLSDDAETQAATISLLEQSVACTDTNCDDAVARWDAVDGKKRRFGAKAILYLCLVIVSGWVLPDVIRILIHFEKTTSCMCGSNFIDFFHNSPRIQEDDIAREFSDSQKMLLFGDMSKSSRLERMKGLWETDPDSPAYYADYAFAYSGEKDKLPPDFLQTARRIDPDNAWLSILQAGSGDVRRSRRTQTGSMDSDTLWWWR